MLPQTTLVDHSSDRSSDKPVVAPPQPRAVDWRAVEELLGLLARAIQQFHTYPAASPLCISAVEACQRALASLEHRDHLSFRVTPFELIVDDIATGRGTQVGREIASRLHKAGVASVAVDRTASARELGRFCEDLVHCGDRATLTLLDRLTEHGVDRVTVEMACRPEVLDVGVVSPATAETLARERVRFSAQLTRGGVVHHLYPPQKGWVRLDPASAPASLSLLELAVLTDDPAVLASMLLRLTGDGDEVPPSAALEKKYSDVSMLISALDPQVARRMFGRLARAVLDLDPTSRQALLRRTVLPGLLDGRADGAILRDFPDVDLAEALCLLLDLETAAPELLTTALWRLDLSPERHAAVLPLLDARLREREAAAPDSGRQTMLARHALELVRIDNGAGKSFAEFVAFDLSLDDKAVAALGQIRAAVPETDTTADQLRCLWHLSRLEPSPDDVGRFMDRSLSLLRALEHASRAGEISAWLAGYRGLADRLRDTRPDVADVITRRLAAFCTPERAAWIVDLSCSGPDGRRDADALIAALGPAIAAPLASLLDSGTSSRLGPGPVPDRTRAAMQLLNGHAQRLAPALAPLLRTSTPGVLRTLIRVLGSGGPGCEEVIALHVSARDEQIAREALRALARLGTAKAAAIVVAEIAKQQGTRSVAAEETLWHFPATEAQRHTRDLLGRREFTTTHPRATERLLDRAARAGAGGLEPVLLSLAPLRFRIWNPALVRVARKAHTMLKASVK